MFRTVTFGVHLAIIYILEDRVIVSNKYLKKEERSTYKIRAQPKK